MPTNFIGVLLQNSPSYTVNTGFSTQLYDADGSQTITVQTGASLSLLGSMGANTVRLSGNASAWQVYRDGSTAIFVNTDGSRVELAANTTAQTLQFDDGTRGLSINTAGATPAVVLGSQTLSLSAAAIEAVAGTPTVPVTPGVGSTDKTPWTLVMHASSSPYSYPSNDGIFTSDGTAAATGLTTVEGVWSASGYSSNMGVRFITNSDQTKAFFYQIGSSWSGSDGSGFSVSTVGVTDGSTAGTLKLMSAANGSYLPGNFATVANNQLVLAGAANPGGTTGQVLVSDGSVVGTTLEATGFAVPGLPYPSYGTRIDDTAHQAVWFAGNSAPYGKELVRFSYDAGGTPTASLVKDIYSGSSGGLGDYYSQLRGAVLPNGKLVFSANDGAHGTEAWVSDGTDADTFMLADFSGYSTTSSSWPDSFTSFGNKVVFSAYTESAVLNSQTISAGQELVFTDGTTVGTTILDVNPGGNSSSPTILGQANGLLYFTATTGGGYNFLTGTSFAQVKGIFSTDGSTFNRLADINSSASLLGWDASKAFFRVSDVAHGDELWAADLVSGGFALVKDILPGTGSALANSYNNAFMVGGKLAFSAYTSATNQSFFLSDGTEAGTVQLSTSLPNLTKVLGNTLIYANADGVFSVAAASATPAAVKLSSQSVGSTQTDADQIFFTTATGDLYASNGSTAGTVKLAGAVSNFKMVAEDALFFIQSTTTTNSTSQALWYSDGTVAGTRFIEDLPSGSYDLANAVALRTADVALPPDTAAPLFASAAVMGNTLTLTYTDANGLDAANPPVASAFSLGGTTATVSSVAVNSSAKTVTLTLSAAVLGTDVVTISYTDPTGGNDAAAIQDSAGNDAASLTSQPVVNQSVDRMAPLFSGAVINGAALTLSYADANTLDATHAPAASAFALSGTSATVSSVAVNSAAKTVVLTLSAAVQVSDVIQVSYTDPTTGNDAAAIQDSAGNDASSLVSRPVANQTLDTIAPVISAATVNGSSLTLTYTDTSPLDAANPPAAAAFSLAGTSATVSTVTVNAAAKTVVLTLSESVKSTDTVTLNYTDPTVGNDVAALQDSAGNDAASLVARAVTNQTPDNMGPVFGSARVNGNTLTLSYTDAALLDSAHAPAASAFTLAGTTATVSGVSVNNGAYDPSMGISTSKTVTLTLSAAVSSSDVLTLSYTDPTTGNDVNAIQDSLGNDAASLVNQAVMNTTSVKAPWTLLLATDNLLYSSDGTAAGTGDISSAILSNSYFYSHQLTVSPDKSKVILHANIYSWTTQLHYNNVYSTDGILGGTQLLAQNISFGPSLYVVGNKVVTGGLMTDGSVTGTTLVADLPVGVFDSANQAIWSGVSTVPYGYELFRTALTSTGATSAMVKDIWSGSSGGLGGSWGGLQGAVLLNGKLVFRANDGIHGEELWVSDGTEAGTALLAEFYPGANSSFGWSGFTNFGDKIVFSVYVGGSTVLNQSGNASGYAGYELVFTDGTSAGTKVLEVTSGQNGGESPAILGEANSLLYFTATAPVAGVDTKGIFSTNGTTFTRLADINSSASLLGWDTSKAFFRVSDVAHGDELWAADLVTGGFALVKDILAGTGSALGSTSASNSFMVGGKLAFTAYTSATAQNFFLSDGTDAGTVQLGSLVTASKVVGNTLVFSDATGVFAVDAASPTPAALALVSGTLGTSGLQADADQVFFTLANGDLYASNGSTAGTVKLAGSVTSVKVVAENALYFIQDTSADPAALWYSDGSSAGTRFIEALPTAVTELSSAVAITTVGVILP